MSKICYVPRRFSPSSQEVIDKAEKICLDYESQGYQLTLRQLYYQFVSRGWIENSDKEYGRLGSIINDARLAGQIDWNHLEDRTRNLADWLHFESPEDRIDKAAESYSVDHWADQPVYVEVWVEKEALAGVVERVCSRNDVPYFSCRGYVSQSEMHVAGRRLADQRDYAREQIVIIHLGDHDPSGIDMSRDIEARLSLFMTQGQTEYLWEEHPDWEENPQYEREQMPEDYVNQFSEILTVERIALNMDQVRQYKPPPNPAKVTDSRAEGYIKKYGTSSWELDALDPRTLDALIQGTISKYRDADKWNASVERVREGKALLRKIAGEWTAVSALVQDQPE